MKGSQSTSEASCHVKISDDAMEAYLLPTRDAAPTLETVVQALQDAGVEVGRQVKTAVVRALGAWAQADGPLPLARGTKAVAPTDDVFELADHLRPPSEREDHAERIDHYAFNSVITVEAGQEIGWIRRGKVGRDGCDVLGRQVPVKERECKQVSFDDKTVKLLADESGKLVALAAGRVIVEDNRVSIRELFIVPGDVDFATGHINSAVEVLVEGTVRDRFEVKSKRTVSIHGAIEAARVVAGGDIQVMGGVAARNNGLLSAKGNISVRFCTDACMSADGDIIVHRQAMNSHLLAGGRLIALRGSIIGGFVHAIGGADLYTVGSEANVRTRLAFGADPDVIEQTERLKEATRRRREQVDAIRSRAMPFVTNFGRLSREQRAQVTELLEKADVLEDELVQMDGQYRRLMKESGGGMMPRVRIAKLMHPGVIVSVGKRAATVQQPLSGPFVIELRQDKGRFELAVVYESSGRVQTLPDAQLDPQELRAEFNRAMERTLAGAKDRA